jgi:hypothetical protein
MNLIRAKVIIGLLSAIAVGALTLTSQVPPPQAAIPGAPTAQCEFPDIDSTTPIAITTGTEKIPYQFACGYNRPSGVCAIGTLRPGLIVSVGTKQDGWACVTGGDSGSGWIPADHLAPVPTTPRAPVVEWLGWWRHDKEAKGVKNDRLLITREPGSNALHISGRAYWYGLNDDVHYGVVQADGAPIGVYLHGVESSSDGTACVIDLKLDPATDTMQAYDNMHCGGMNVRFSGDWRRFTPN